MIVVLIVSKLDLTCCRYCVTKGEYPGGRLKSDSFGSQVLGSLNLLYVEDCPDARDIKKYCIFKRRLKSDHCFSRYDWVVTDCGRLGTGIKLSPNDRADRDEGDIEVVAR